MSTYQIRKDDLSSKEVRALLELHMQGMLDSSPAHSVFALDLSGLQTPDVIVWSAWNENDLVGIGALKRLDGGTTGELKSMRTAPGYLRNGVGTALLEHIIRYARSQGLKRLSLETGSGNSFEAALGLYRKRGFVNGDAFADYSNSEFNQFLPMDL